MYDEICLTHICQLMKARSGWWPSFENKKLCHKAWKFRKFERNI